MRKIFFYDRNQFFNLKKQQMSCGGELLSMSQFLSSQKVNELDEDVNYYVDLSSLVGFIRVNDTQTWNFEQLFNNFGENITFICDEVYEEDIKYLLRYVFDEFVDIDVEAENISLDQSEDEHKKVKKVRKITDLDETELEAFFNIFDSRLYGHNRFKEEFKRIVESFRVFNKIGEHKILSLFLIGSPLGYIGSDGGELVKRMSESDIGLILIDEFEKADNAVFNYFLDVLENGKVVNSQAEEYDVNGYIIVFTSNISKENFKKKISPELRSRFDYKGVFNLLTEEDKLKFMHFRVNQIVDKYKKFVTVDIPDRIHDDIVNEIDVSQYNNMRELNKKIKDTFVAKIKS